MRSRGPHSPRPHLYTHTTHHPLLHPLILQVSLARRTPASSLRVLSGPLVAKRPGPEWSLPCTAAHRNAGSQARHTHHTRSKIPLHGTPSNTDPEPNTHTCPHFGTDTDTHSTSHTQVPTTQGPRCTRGYINAYHNLPTTQASVLQLQTHTVHVHTPRCSEMQNATCLCPQAPAATPHTRSPSPS